MTSGNPQNVMSHLTRMRNPNRILLALKHRQHDVQLWAIQRIIETLGGQKSIDFALELLESREPETVMNGARMIRNIEGHEFVGRFGKVSDALTRAEDKIPSRYGREPIHIPTLNEIQHARAVLHKKWKEQTGLPLDPP